MNKLFAYSLILWLCSCSHHKLTPEEFIQYVDNERNGLIKHQDIHMLRFSFQYRPAAYEVIKSNIDHIPDQRSFNELVKNYDGLQYILFRISSLKKGVDPFLLNGSGKSYEEMMTYMSGSIINDLKLIDGRDTLSCAIHHWERTFHITDYHTLILGFDKPNNRKEDASKTLLYKDELFGTGDVYLSIDHNDIKKIPDIEI